MPEVRKLFDKVLLITYDTCEQAARAFCRVQEHYECADSDFKGKTFTLGEYREWYTDKFGKWSYYKDWQGFNVPCEKFKPFILGSFDPLLPEEQELVEIVRYLDPAFYVICVGKDADADVLEHETAHALYATDQLYRDKVDLIFREYEFDANMGLCKYSLAALNTKLRSMGYSDSVLVDECHAYMAASQQWIRDNNIDVDWNLASRMRSNLLRRIEIEEERTQS